MKPLTCKLEVFNICKQGHWASNKVLDYGRLFTWLQRFLIHVCSLSTIGPGNCLQQRRRYVLPQTRVPVHYMNCFVLELGLLESNVEEMMIGNMPLKRRAK